MKKQLCYGQCNLTHIAILLAVFPLLRFRMEYDPLNKYALSAHISSAFWYFIRKFFSKTIFSHCGLESSKTCFRIRMPQCVGFHVMLWSHQRSSKQGYHTQLHSISIKKWEGCRETQEAQTQEITASQWHLCGGLALQGAKAPCVLKKVVGIT